MMKARSCGGLMVVACLGAPLRDGVAAPLGVTFVNSVTLGAAATDQNGAGFTVTGMSGVVRLPDGAFASVMDNANKIVRFSISINLVDQVS